MKFKRCKWALQTIVLFTVILLLAGCLPFDIDFEDTPTQAPTTPFPSTVAPTQLPDDNAMPPDLTPATVTEVVDGDTIVVRIGNKNYRVRYILVDTPETKHPDKGVEPFGLEASAANEALVGGKTVYLEKDVSETDRYGRLLRYVYVDGLMVNEALLRRGLARVSTFPPDVKYVERFLAIQAEAQATRTGLWHNFNTDLALVDKDPVAEYVTITNRGDTVLDLGGWLLKSERGGETCPLSELLFPGDAVRVWSLAEDANQGGLNCGRQRTMWNNTEPDAALLLNPDGAEVSRLE